MTLFFLPIHFVLHFEWPIVVDTLPLFILRSMLGKELHSMSCIAQQNKCPECMYNKTCAYAFLFETILPSENEITPGRDRASHPFVFSRGAFKTNKKISDYAFTITLLGKAVDYLPYIYASFVQAGKAGIFMERVPFSVTNVSVGKENILIDSGYLDTSIARKAWTYDKTLANKTGEVLIELRSPLRFKHGGTYGEDFTARDFFSCLYRRMKTICLLYGNKEDLIEYQPSESISIIEENLFWQDNNHYSARQKKNMSLGGITGTLKLSGTFSAAEQNLLEFARLFSAGKNTNFGLGQLDFWPRWE